MIRSVLLEAPRQQAVVPSIGIRDLDRRHSTGLGSAENDQATVRRFARAEIPHTRLVLRDAFYPASCRIQSANLHTSMSRFRFVIAIEMVRVRAVGLEFPGDS